MQKYLKATVMNFTLNSVSSFVTLCFTTGFARKSHWPNMGLEHKGGQIVVCSTCKVKFSVWKLC